MPNPFQSGELPERQSLRGRNVLIMGLGSFGGGLGAARFCAQQGANLTVTDLRSDTELRPTLSKLQGLKIQYRLGTHEGINFAGYDAIVVNPAVDPRNPLLDAARNAGVYLTSEMNLFMARCPGKVVGITGSNGKTTTTALTAHLMKASDRKVWMGGNIGMSLLERAHEIGEKDAVVLELSSYQLEDLHRSRISPTVGILLNLSPNHLDRHGSMEGCAAAKMAIFAWQTPKDIALLNYDDVRVARLQQEVKSRLAMFSVARKVQPGGYIMRSDFTVDLGGGAKSVCPVKDLQLPGRHNRSNALAAIIAAMVMRTPAKKIGDQLRSFKGVEHRCEYVGDRESVKFYNDSVSTTPESTIASLTGFKQADTWLILGGADKGLQYEQLAETIATQQRVAGVACIGEIGPEMAHVVRSACESRGRQLQIIEAGSLPDAMDELRRTVRPNQIVLLSPATSSYDQYNNFEERGGHFKELVVRWQRAAGAVAPRGRRLTPDAVKVSTAQPAATHWKQVTPAAPPMFPGSRPGVPQAPHHPHQPAQPARPAQRQGRPAAAPAGPAARQAQPHPLDHALPPLSPMQPMAPMAGVEQWPDSSLGAAAVAPQQSDALIDPWAPDATNASGAYPGQPGESVSEEDWSADPWNRGQTEAGMDAMFPPSEAGGETWVDMQAVQDGDGLPAEASATWTESNPMPQNFENPFAAGTPGTFPNVPGGITDSMAVEDFSDPGSEFSEFSDYPSDVSETQVDPFAGAQPMAEARWSDSAAAVGWADSMAAEAEQGEWSDPSNPEMWADTHGGAPGGGGMASAEQIFGADSTSEAALPAYGSNQAASPFTAGAPVNPDLFAGYSPNESVFGNETSSSFGTIGDGATETSMGTVSDAPMSLFNADGSGGAEAFPTDAASTISGQPPSLFRTGPQLIDPMDTGTMPRFQVPGMKGFTGGPPPTGIPDVDEDGSHSHDGFNPGGLG